MTSLLLHLAGLLLLPPLLLGVIVRAKARIAGRRGAPLLQCWFDVWKLVRKDLVASRATTGAFLAGPAIGAAALLLAGSVVPGCAGAAPIHFQGDAVFLVGLLALARFATAAAALDTGSAFEGMGAAREVTFACCAEPALLLALLALARITGGQDLSSMLGPATAAAWQEAAPSLVLVASGLFLVLLVENSRIPFDDPNTHLELTMIHEVMVLDHGGPALGLIQYAAAVKLYLLSALLVRLTVPVASGSAWLDALAFAAGAVGLAVLIGLVESTMARLRLVHVPTLLIGASLLAGFGFALLVR